MITTSINLLILSVCANSAKWIKVLLEVETLECPSYCMNRDTGVPISPPIRCDRIYFGHLFKDNANFCVYGFQYRSILSLCILSPRQAVYFSSWRCCNLQSKVTLVTESQKALSLCERLWLFYHVKTENTSDKVKLIITLNTLSYRPTACLTIHINKLLVGLLGSFYNRCKCKLQFLCEMENILFKSEWQYRHRW